MEWYVNQVPSIDFYNSLAIELEQKFVELRSIVINEEQFYQATLYFTQLKITKLWLLTFIHLFTLHDILELFNFKYFHSTMKNLDKTIKKRCQG